MRRSDVIALVFTSLISGCADRHPTSPIASSAAIDPYLFVLHGTEDSRLAAIDGSQPAFIQVSSGLHQSLPSAARHSWSPEDPATAWNRVTTDLGIKAGLPPPLFARAYALVHVAIYDALVVAEGHRRGWMPSVVVSAGAASRVLEELFPNSAARDTIAALAESYRRHSSRTEEGARAWALGRTVGQIVVIYGQRDGHDAVYVGTPPTGPGYWTGVNPVLPMCGTWRCWIAAPEDNLQPEPPYPLGSAEDLRDVAEVSRVALTRTSQQVAIVHKWAAFSPSSVWNSQLIVMVDKRHLDPLASARAFAFMNVAMYDAFVCCWKSKYTYWSARPIQRSPNLTTVIPTPNFPTYVSGHSTISAAAASILTTLFPDQGLYFEREATEAAASRLFAGIHFRHDNDQGLIMGRKVGARVVSIMNQHMSSLMAAR